jgi:hypothetical protein
MMFNKTLLAAATATLAMCAAMSAQAYDNSVRVHVQDAPRILTIPLAGCTVTGGGDFRNLVVTNVGRVVIPRGQTLRLYEGQSFVTSVTLTRDLAPNAKLVAWYGSYTGGGCTVRLS